MASLKPLPCDEKALSAEMSCLGFNLENPRAKLLDHINNSRKIGRNVNQASIVLVGQSGVGKSASVNHLFGFGNDGTKLITCSGTAQRVY